jgi:probable selenium-dependent hydroxylase accessory protein YqeC
VEHFLFKYLHEKKHIVSLVGAGGKTTVMYQLAEHFASLGKKVLVSTTTHIFQPACNFAQNIAEVEALWQAGSYAVVGNVEAGTGKLTQLQTDVFETYSAIADLVLIEADGAKRLPCKAPAENEPVLLPASDTVIAVMGLDALHQPILEVCFRLEKVQEVLAVTPEHCLTEEDAVKLLLSEQGAFKNVGQRNYFIVLNKCDDKNKLDSALKIKSLLGKEGFDLEKLWIRGEAYSE